MGLGEIFELNISEEEIALAWINSYSGMVVKTHQATLLFDPVMVSPVECIRSDVIVITHEHYDHFAPELVKKLHKNTSSTILTTRFVAERLAEDNTQILNEGDSISIKDCQLDTVHCEHAANEPLAFMISARNGVMIYHPSDSKPFKGMAKLREAYKPDILLCPGNSLENAARIAGLVKPKVAVSYYSDAESEERFVSLISKESPTTQATTLRRFEVYRYRSPS